MGMGRIAEEGQIVPFTAPVDLASGGFTGDFVSLQNYNHLTVIFHADPGTASEDPVITVNQAQDNAGTGSKALNFTTVYQKEGADLASVGQFTKITQASANTYTSLTGGENEQLILIEFDGAELDVDNAFDHVQVSVADTGATAGKLGVCLALLTQPAYAKEPALAAI